MCIHVRPGNGIPFTLSFTLWGKGVRTCRLRHPTLPIPAPSRSGTRLCTVCFTALRNITLRQERMTDTLLAEVAAPLPPWISAFLSLFSGFRSITPGFLPPCPPPHFKMLSFPCFREERLIPEIIRNVTGWYKIELQSLSSGKSDISKSEQLA